MRVHIYETEMKKRTNKYHAIWVRYLLDHYGISYVCERKCLNKYYATVVVPRNRFDGSLLGGSHLHLQGRLDTLMGTCCMYA